MNVTRHNADRVTKQRHKRLAVREAQIHRCDGCGDWLYAKHPCMTCPAIAAQRATEARRHLGVAS